MNSGDMTAAHRTLPFGTKDAVAAKWGVPAVDDGFVQAALIAGRPAHTLDDIGDAADRNGACPYACKRLTHQRNDE
jgi:hypothetical protein